MRSLLKLMMMGRSFVCRRSSSSMKMYKATTPRFTSSFRPAYCYLQAPPISFLPDYKLTLQGKYRGADEETKGESGLEQPIIKGDMINLHDLLFTQDRDHLVKYNDDRKVKAAELGGKVIVLYFMPLHHDYSFSRMGTSSLTDTYTYLLPDNVFEVVLVAYGTAKEILSNDVHRFFKKRFEAIFSRMPWTAIPFSDIASRERLVCRFGIDRLRCYCTSVVIDSTGMVLQSDSGKLFHKYGGLGYPFSDKRIEFIKSEDDTNAKNPQLKALLGSPKRDYVISNKGDKVLIDTLKEKVVALYFYQEGITPDWQTTNIMTAYEEFAQKKSCFEVVLIYLYDTSGTLNRTSEESFCKTFETMPWLALPFKDPKCGVLRRFFGYPYDRCGPGGDPTLVIFGPHGEFIEPWGADIINKFKLPAFPFTRERLVKLHNEKVKELTLEMILDPNTIFRGKNGNEVRFSQLVGKRIILFFEGTGEEGYEFRKKTVFKFLSMLKERYFDTRGRRDEFEVIYIANNKTDSPYNDHIVDAPWFVSHASELLPVDLSLYCCYCHLVSVPFFPPCSCGKRSDSSMLAFDRDGRVVRKSKELFSLEHLDFPFNAVSMEMEAFYELSNFYSWSEMDRYHEGLLINSYYVNENLPYIYR